MIAHINNGPATRLFTPQTRPARPLEYDARGAGVLAGIRPDHCADRTDAHDRGDSRLRLEMPYTRDGPRVDNGSLTVRRVRFWY